MQPTDVRISHGRHAGGHTGFCVERCGRLLIHSIELVSYCPDSLVHVCQGHPVPWYPGPFGVAHRALSEARAVLAETWQPVGGEAA